MCVCVCVYHIFIHSSVGRHLGSFHILAIVDIAAINIGVHVPVQSLGLYPLGKYLAVQLLGHRVFLFFTFFFFFF